MNNNKSEIRVFSKGYLALVAFFLFGFIVFLGSFIYLYFIVKRTVGIHTLVSIIFIVVFGGLTLFTYSMFGAKVYICGERIIAKKWYGKKTTFFVGDIEEVIFEKSEGKIDTVSIKVKKFRDKYIDEKENFEKMINYLLEKVDREKIVCYQLGTKIEMVWDEVDMGEMIQCRK